MPTPVGHSLPLGPAGSYSTPIAKDEDILVCVRARVSGGVRLWLNPFLAICLCLSAEL